MNPPAVSDGSESSAIPFHQFLRDFAPGYLERFGARVPARQRQVLHRILRCRTASLGGQLFQCPQCGEAHYRYHSCNDRHCAQCGQADAHRWLESQRQRLLLPTPYFLLTFTVPEALRRWFAAQPQTAFDRLFAASAQALQDLAAQPRHLGGQLGLLGVLHTWSRTLIFHPHVHYLVPGGALRPDGRSWSAARRDFFLPVKALGARFRTRFQDAVRAVPAQIRPRLPARIWKTSWVVHSQPAGSGEHALRYLSRYLFRTATTNRPVRVRPDGRVAFDYQDSQTGQTRALILEPHELIRRFLQHVLPPGFCRVRCFGWFHPAAKVRANRVRALLGEKPWLTEAERAAWQPPSAPDAEPPLPGETVSPDATRPHCARCQRPMQPIANWKPGQPLPQPLPLSLLLNLLKARPP